LLAREGGIGVCRSALEYLRCLAEGLYACRNRPPVAASGTAPAAGSELDGRPNGHCFAWMGITVVLQ
jgi:hypothetical protein